MSMTSKTPSFVNIAADAARVADGVRGYLQPNSSMFVPAAVFFSGAIVGAFAALTLAPTTGRDFRRMIAARFSSWRDVAEDGVEAVREATHDAMTSSHGAKPSNNEPHSSKPAQA